MQIKEPARLVEFFAWVQELDEAYPPDVFKGCDGCRHKGAWCECDPGVRILRILRDLRNEFEKLFPPDPLEHDMAEEKARRVLTEAEDYDWIK